MTKAETKIYGLMNKATEQSMICLPRYARVLEETEKAVMISGKDRKGDIFAVIFLKAGKVDFFESRNLEDVECKMLTVA